MVLELWNGDQHGGGGRQMTEHGGWHARLAYESLRSMLPCLDTISRQSVRSHYSVSYITH